MDGQLNYEELLTRLTDAEEIIHALVSEQADAIISPQGVHLLRLHETDEALKLAKSQLEKMLGERTQELASTNQHLQREIADRRQAEQRLSSIIACAMDAVITVDEQMRVLIFNRAAEKTFGYSATQVIGESIDRLFPERYRQSHRIEIQHSGNRPADPGSLSLAVLYGLRHDGTEFPVEATISQVKNGAEKLYTVILRDVSRRKLTEAALIRSEKLASVGRVAAMIAHEINNPLSAITNILFLLRNDDMSPEARQYLALAENEVLRAAQIAENTLGLSRQTAHAQRFQLSEAVDGVLVLLQRKLQEKSITVKKRSEDFDIVAVPGEIRQVVWNMLTNALDAVPERGRIEVRVSQCRGLRSGGESAARITVADNGGGISRDALDHILEPFFTTKLNGTGLGLWISYEIVKKHAGSLKVRSSTLAKQNGTVVSVYIPSGLSSSQSLQKIG